MKARDSLKQAIAGALDRLGFAKENIPIVLERPREATHGDMSSPIAMALARKLRRNPIDIAGKIAASMEYPAGEITSVDVIKPGFINFRFTDSILRAELLAVLEAGKNYGTSTVGGGKRWLIEYVSANPTGPLIIVSARAAAVGSAIVNLLRYAGFDAEGEYYVNDYGGQVAAIPKLLPPGLRSQVAKGPAFPRSRTDCKRPRSSPPAKQQSRFFDESWRSRCPLHPAQQSLETNRVGSRCGFIGGSSYETPIDAPKELSSLNCLNVLSKIHIIAG